MKSLVRRYIVFFISLFIISFGLSLVAKSALGCTPISAIPYTLSLIIPRLTIGNWTIVISIILILLQWIILKKDISKLNMLKQLIMSLVFGYVIDFSMWILTSFEPEAYIVKLISLLIGCVIIAFGAYLEVLAGVVLLPPDGISQAIVIKTNKEFGTIKTYTDSAQAGIAAILCLVFLHELVGVREGTVIAALLIGNIIKLISRLCKPLEKFLLGQE